MGRQRRFMLWLPLRLGLLTFVVIACRPPQQETAIGTPNVPPPMLTEPATMAPATFAPTGTPLAIPRTTTPLPTTAPGSGGISIPQGWFLLNGGGVSLLIPDSWLDLSPLLFDDTLSPQLGPNTRLYSVDDKRTSQRLLSGRELNGGAFVLAFARPVAGADTPAEGLAALLASAGASPSPLRMVSIRGQQAAFVDVIGDPLGLLPGAPAALHLRLVLIASGVADTYLLLALGSASDTFADFDEVFTFIAQTVRITAPETLIALNVLPAAVLGSLGNGENVQATLAVDNQDIWSFQAEAGQYLTVRLAPIDGIDLALRLLDANGRTLAISDGGFAGDPEALLDQNLPRSGIYYLYIDEFSNRTGRYNLSFALINTPTFSAGGQIALGQVVQGTMQGSEENAWRFAGLAGQRVTIVLNPDSDQLDVVLRLIGPDGRRLLNLDEGFSGDAEVGAGIDLPISGEYTIIIKDFSARGGSYHLSLEETIGELTNFFEAGDLASGAVYQETLQFREAHAWFFTGFAGDEIRLQVMPLSSRLDLDLWLLSPHLDRLAMQDQNVAGAGEIIHMTLPEDGQYVVLVQDYYGDSGSYQIGLTVLGNSRLLHAGDLLYRLPVTATLPVAKTALWYLFIFPDEEVTITLSPISPESDLVLYLKDESGRTLLRVDNGGPGVAETITDYMPAAAGKLLVMVEEYLGRGGAYRLEADRPFR